MTPRPPAHEAGFRQLPGVQELVGRTWPDVVDSLLKRTRWLPWALLSVAPYGLMMWLAKMETWRDFSLATAISALGVLVGVLANRLLSRD